MLNNSNSWKKMGLIIKPDPNVDWMATHTGASFAFPSGRDDVFDLYVTGRDKMNRSHIGKIQVNITNSVQILEKSCDPIFSPGELGAFDENGVSYPSIVKNNEFL